MNRPEGLNQGEDEADPVDSSPQQRPRFAAVLARRILPRVLLIAALGLGIYLIVRNGPALGNAISQVGVWPLLASLLLGTVGTLAIGQVWICLLRGLGATVGTAAGTEVFFVSQLGKYLPGSVWPVLAQMEFGRRSGTGPRVMLAANIMMMVAVVSSGLIVAAGILPFAGSDGLGTYWPVFLVLIPLVLCLHPRFVPMVLDRLFVLARRQPLNLRVSTRLMLQAYLWAFVVWLLLGGHVAVMTVQFGGAVSGAVLVSIGAMSLAFAAGIVFIPAPAGAGIRDAVIVTFLGPQVGAANALAIALASRVVLVIADVVLAGLGLIVGRLSRSGATAG